MSSFCLFQKNTPKELYQQLTWKMYTHHLGTSKDFIFTSCQLTKPVSFVVIFLKEVKLKGANWGKFQTWRT